MHKTCKEKNPVLKQDKLLSCIVVGIPTLLSMATNFIFPAFKIEGTYVYNIGVIIVSFIIFIIAAARYGIMGVKLRFEKHRFAAIETIMDHITDGFVVIDEKFNVTRLNQTFKNYFGEVKLGQNLLVVMENNIVLGDLKGKLIEFIDSANNSKEMVYFEWSAVDGSVSDKYFNVEISPIVLPGKNAETVILFKDITEQKNILFLIEQNQKQQIENERLFSLSQLIGGIAHNLKTPLMASSGGIEILSVNTQKIRESIEQLETDNGKKKISAKDIIEEMEMWEDRIRDYISYMNEVITTVKGQAVPNADNPGDYFKVKDIISRVNILMKHEIQKASCVMNFESSVDEDLKIKGNINYIIQVLNNLISNSVDSYENKKDGIIEIIIERKLSDKIAITVKDYGRGIKDEVKDKLFKQMITTKGKNGTGLGLYISKSILASKFSGEISVESEIDKGSSFTIIIPIGGEENG